MRFDPETTAVVVVDMQNDFCHPDGALYAEAGEAAIEPIASLIERARDHAVQVIFTRDVHALNQFEDAHYTDEFERWGEHVLEGSWGAEIVEELQVRPPDHVVEKATYDAFFRTDLGTYLEQNGLRDLLFVGTLANVCVLHTAATAALRDRRPVIVEDAVGYVESAHREYALEHAEWVFAETTTLEEISFG